MPRNSVSGGPSTNECAFFGKIPAQRNRIHFAEKTLAAWEVTVRSIKQLIMTEQERMNEDTTQAFSHLIVAQERCLRTTQEVLATIRENLDQEDCDSLDSVKDSVEGAPTPSDSGTAPSTLSLSISPVHSDASAKSGISLDQQPFIRSSGPSPEPLQALQLPILSEIESASSVAHEAALMESQDIAEPSQWYPIPPSQRRPAWQDSSRAKNLKPSWPLFKAVAVTQEPLPGVWIMDRKWHVDVSSSHLSHAEAQFSREDFQAGLITLDTVLATSTKTSEFRKLLLKKRIPMGDFRQRINGYLLRSYALLEAGEARQGLQSADTALRLADEISLNQTFSHMQSKSQLYRGLCLMELKLWEEASAALTRAASITDWKGRVAELMNEAQRNLAFERRERYMAECGRI